MGNLRKVIGCCRSVFFIPKGITGSSDTLLQYPMTLRKGPKDPYLPSLQYMLCEFKKYLCPLYIVFSTAQKKKASHHHPLGGTSFLLWYIDSTLSCKGKKVLRRAMSNDIVHHHDVLIFLLLPSIQ